MDVSRREVMRWLVATATGAAVLPALEGIAGAVAARQPAPPVYWFNEGEELNLLTHLGRLIPSFSKLIAEEWQLAEYGPLMPTGFSGAGALPQAAPIVILETLPREDQLDSPAVRRMFALVKLAKTAILLGTDACFGGLGTAAEDVARMEAFCRREKTPLIKLPGLPVPPQHLVGTLGHLEFFGFPALDIRRRPLLYYGETVCRRCEFRGDLERGRFARRPGEAGCLLKLGCKGPVTHNSCSRIRWNEAETWCVGAGGPCTGCSEPGFPDHNGLGLYGAIPGDAGGNSSGLLQHLDRIGFGMLGLAATGIGLHLLRKVTARDRSAPRPSRQGKGA